MPVQNAEIAGMFDQAAELLEIRGANQFRVRAYRKAARLIETLPQNVRSLLASGRNLADLPGIGKDLAGKIASIVSTGHFDLLDQLKKEMPGDLVAMAALPGLGPKRIKLLYDKLRVRSLDDLRRAAKAGRLHATRGLGEAVEKKILAALDKPPQEQRFKLSVAEAEAEALVALLSAGSKTGQVVVAGSYRRRRDTVGDLDVLATAEDGAIAERLIGYENVVEVLAHGPARTTVKLRSGLQVDLRVIGEESFGAALLYFTGSKSHNIALRKIANDRNWKLSEYGLFSGKRRIAGATEEEVYQKLGLAYIPPELREDRGEIAGAQARKLPKLVTAADIRGDLHVHTNWSDGNAPLADMAAAAKARGYEYVAITDHSRRVAVAHGLDRARLSRQIGEIDRLNEKLGKFAVLKGVEVDILLDGTLDLPDSILARLDVVVASVHSHFDLPRAAQTDRIIRAMENQYVSIVGHPTGRLIGEREPYDFDIDRILSAAHDLNCCLEINAEPDRLDLNDIHAQAAQSHGVKLAISTDAHSPEALTYMRFGLDQARRGWLTADDVVNTRPLGALKKLLKRS